MICLFFIKNLACGAFFSYIFFLNRDEFDLKFLILSTNSFVVKMIRGENDSNSNTE